MRFRTAFCTKCNASRVRVRGRCNVCGETLLGESKYRSKPTRDATGKLKHSRKEAHRGNALLAAYRGGAIRELVPDPDDPRSRQQPFKIELYANDAVEALVWELEQRKELPPMLVFLINQLRQSKQKVCMYYADYVYKVAGSDKLVVEDVKGHATSVYRLKKKLLMLSHNIEIKET